MKGNKVAIAINLLARARADLQELVLVGASALDGRNSVSFDSLVGQGRL